MKLKKETTKKLTINKQTVAHLGNIDMDKARGGTDWTITGITCWVCDSKLSCIYCKSCETHEYFCG